MRIFSLCAACVILAVALASLIVILSGCEPMDSDQVSIGDTPTTVYYTSFTLQCDRAKRLVVVLTNPNINDKKASELIPVGLFGAPEYVEWCE